jgi:hypothetical protein
VNARYDFHGVSIEVATQLPAVAAAMELRLRDFAVAAGARARDVTFTFARSASPLALPDGPRRPVYDTPYGTLHWSSDGSDVVFGELAGVRMCCAASAGEVVIGAASLTGFQLYLATHPLATIALMELMERRGLHCLHAGCLASSGRGVLLAGPSGAGKSTLTLALARAGLGLLSDDVVFLSTDGSGGVSALGFADTLGVGEFAASRFPELRSMSEREPAEGFPKRLARIEKLFGAPSVSRCVPVAIVFPEVSLELPSAIAPLDPAEALLRLTPDVLLTDPASTQAHLGAIGALLAQVQCYAVRSGTDFERAAELVAELVTR